MGLPHVFCSKGKEEATEAVTMGSIPTRGEGRYLCACEARLIIES